MIDPKLAANKNIPDSQQSHWVQTFGKRSELFGPGPSEPAQKAAALFKKEGKSEILELGAGQGRDAIFFARLGFKVYALDYAANGLAATVQKARKLDVLHLVTAMQHDIRRPLPFESKSFDACYSHMLFCMELTTKELVFLSEEISRVLKPGGICIYSVRHTGDQDYGKGIPVGEDMFELNGFIVHFFDKVKIERLANGYQIIGIDEFEEGSLPRKLFQVTLRKPEYGTLNSFQNPV